jgi:tRNA-dihydrouridine synthase A
VFGAAPPSASRIDAVEAHIPYIARKLEEGVPLHAMTRHMLGLFNAQPGGRAWRRTLSERGVRAGTGVEVVRDALAEVSRAPARAA